MSECLLQGFTVCWGEGSDNCLFRGGEQLDCFRAGLLSGWRERGSDAAAVVWVFDAADKLVGFETVNELRDVGADAAVAFGEFTQGEWCAGFGEIFEDADLGEGETEASEGGF